MISSCSVIIRKSLGQEPATLGIRAAWAMLSNADIEVKIILMGDGVYSVLGKSGYMKRLYERFLGEEGEAYAIKEDLEARGLDADALPAGTSVVAASEISALIGDTDSVMTF